MKPTEFLNTHITATLAKLGYYETEVEEICRRVIEIYLRNEITSVPVLLETAKRLAQENYGKPRLKAK